jgi:hypothetical protein
MIFREPLLIWGSKQVRLWPPRKGKLVAALAASSGHNLLGFLHEEN